MKINKACSIAIIILAGAVAFAVINNSLSGRKSKLWFENSEGNKIGVEVKNLPDKFSNPATTLTKTPDDN